MARTPDLAGALEAVVARTIKGTIGSRLRRVEGQLRRLDRKMKKVMTSRRVVGRKRGRRAGRPRRRGRRGRR